jgi:Protein of unknown function (DUF402)
MLSPGTQITIIKLRPDGTEATRYPGQIMAIEDGWIAARAVWDRGRFDLGCLVFEPGDVFHEYFPLQRPFNAFAVYAPDGRYKGWYCNVTLSTRVEGRDLYWQDLYVDLVVCPDGRTLVLDEDELADSGIADRDPALYRLVMDAAETLQRLVREPAYPFSDGPVEG